MSLKLLPHKLCKSSESQRLCDQQASHTGSTNTVQTLCCSCRGGKEALEEGIALPPSALPFSISLVTTPPLLHPLLFFLQAFRGEEAPRAQSHARPQWVPDPGVRQMPAPPDLLCVWRPRPTCWKEPTSSRQGLAMGWTWGGRPEGDLAIQHQVTCPPTKPSP